MRDLRHDWTLPELESIYTTTPPDLMPASQVRLSAGRLELSDEAQALCFVPGPTRDEQLLDRLGMKLTTMEA